MKLTTEQRRRACSCVPAFHKFMFEGTINHARKLASAGMVAEAVEIIQEFKPMTKTEAETYLK